MLPSQCRLTLAALLVCGCLTAHGARKNGFDLSNATVPASEILSGGPGRDGIPAMDRPKFVLAKHVRFLQPDDEVVSISVDGVTRAYPLRILVWHEIANDTLGGVPVAVTYCPLCGTAMVFGRRIGDRRLTFGVSGLLYQSDVLMYDRQTGSLWSQLKMEAVSGPLVGTGLVWLPSEQLTWGAWKRRNPGGEVLSTDTGLRRDYSRQPYKGYEKRDATMFPVPRHRQELRNKEWVAGIVVNGEAAAYVLNRLKSHRVVDDVVGGTDVRVEYDAPAHAVRAANTQDGKALPVVKVYWFAWQAFHPDTRLWGR